jgi:uncharacterized protein (TIGR02246 family)
MAKSSEVAILRMSDQAMGDSVVRQSPDRRTAQSRIQSSAMARILLNSFLLAFSLLVTAPRAAAQAANPASELKQMQQRLLDALLANRRDEYAALLAPEWRVTYVDGTVRVKQEVLEEVFGDAEPPLRSGKIDRVDVRFLAPELAVVTGRTEATPQTGATVRLSFVDVAMKRDGRWMITASFASFASER